MGDEHAIRRVKNKILEQIVRKHEAGYDQLSKYTEMLKLANPGSITYIKWDDLPEEGLKPVFKRMFWYCNACKKGFSQGCRKIIGVDGCHLK